MYMVFIIYKLYIHTFVSLWYSIDTEMYKDVKYSYRNFGVVHVVVEMYKAVPGILGCDTFRTLKVTLHPAPCEFESGRFDLLYLGAYGEAKGFLECTTLLHHNPYFF